MVIFSKERVALGRAKRDEASVFPLLLQWRKLVKARGSVDEHGNCWESLGLVDENLLFDGCSMMSLVFFLVKSEE